MNSVSLGRTLILAALINVSLIHFALAEDKALWDTDDQTIVKRSRNNICHDKNDPSFEQTLHFRAYKTMKDCLESGGKPAKNATTS